MEKNLRCGSSLLSKIRILMGEQKRKLLMAGYSPLWSVALVGTGWFHSSCTVLHSKVLLNLEQLLCSGTISIERSEGWCRQTAAELSQSTKHSINILLYVCYRRWYFKPSRTRMMLDRFRSSYSSLSAAFTPNGNISDATLSTHCNHFFRPKSNSAINFSVFIFLSHSNDFSFAK